MTEQVSSQLMQKGLLLHVLMYFLSHYGYAQEKLGIKEVLIDNAFVEMVRLTYPQGTESGMHTHHHPYRTVYVIEGGRLLVIPKGKGKEPRVLDIIAGQTLFLKAETHNIQNIGETTVVIIETELKQTQK